MEYIIGSVIFSSLAIFYKYNKKMIYEKILDKLSKINLFIKENIELNFPTKEFEIISVSLIYNEYIENNEVESENDEHEVESENNEHEVESENDEHEVESENDEHEVEFNDNVNDGNDNSTKESNIELDKEYNDTLTNEMIYRKLDIKDLFLFNINNINKIDNTIFDNILNTFNLQKENDTRIVIKYKFYDKEYYIYWTGQEIKIPFYTNEKINKLKKKYFKDNFMKKSLYMLLKVELKGIKNVYYVEKDKQTGDDIIINDEKLLILFNRLKGPLNDYGYINNCLIKNRWIYQDFELEEKYKIVLIQGLYMNDNFELISKNHELINNEEVLKFDIFDKYLRNI